MLKTWWLVAAGLVLALASWAGAVTRPAGVDGVASARYDRCRQVLVEVVAAEQFAGETVAVREGRRTLGRGTLVAKGKDAAVTVTLPMPALGKTYGPLTVKADRVTLATVTLPDAGIARATALYDQWLFFQRYVFDGEKLPTCDFVAPRDVEALIGPYTLTVRYYNAQGQEVTKAATPGRYGAVVEVTGKFGPVHRRFATLYRQPERVDWWRAELQAKITLPAGLGVDPAVAAAQSRVIGEYLQGRFVDGFSHDEGSGALFATLHEQTPATIGDVWSADGAWWFAQKKRLGLLQHRYRSVLPVGYDTHPDARYPLILFLHGSGERGLDIEKVASPSPEQYVRAHPELGCIYIAPQCDPNNWWDIATLNDLLDEVLAKYRVDPDRVYLTGLSMGGYGSWGLGCAHPERFAALAPICGGGDPAQAARLQHLPTWVFHGAKDTTVPISESQRMVDALKTAGGTVQFTIYPEAGHDSWTATYANPEFYAWLFAQRRENK